MPAMILDPLRSPEPSVFVSVNERPTRGTAISCLLHQDGVQVMWVVSRNTSGIPSLGGVCSTGVDVDNVPLGVRTSYCSGCLGHYGRPHQLCSAVTI